MSDEELMRLAREACLGDAGAFAKFCSRWRLAFGRPQLRRLMNILARMYDRAYKDPTSLSWADFCHAHIRTFPGVGRLTLGQIPVERASKETCLLCCATKCPTCGDRLMSGEGIFKSCVRCGERV